MERKEVLVIIPAYNEADSIEAVLDALEQPEIAEIADILVMNDASTDDTNWIAKKRGYAVVTHVFNLGYGSGLQLGYKYAIRRGYKYVIQMDGDGQHDVCNIPIIYQRLKEKDEDEQAAGYCAWRTFYGWKRCVSGICREKDCFWIVSYDDTGLCKAQDRRSYNGASGLKPQSDIVLLKI